MMCEKPFIHKSAFYDVKTNFIFQEDFEDDTKTTK